MHDGDWELIGDIRHGGELSFEQAEAQEALLRERIAECVSGFGPLYLDFRHGGDDLTFTAAVRTFGTQEADALGNALRAELDPQARGRLVAVGRGFGPVLVRAFSRRGMTASASVEESL